MKIETDICISYSGGDDRTIRIKKEKDGRYLIEDHLNCSNAPAEWKS